MNKTAVILNREEVAALPQAKRPLNYRLPGDIYHAVFEHVGWASRCWTKEQVFDTDEATKCALSLCFKIAEELERLEVDPTRIHKNAPPQP